MVELMVSGTSLLQRLRQVWTPVALCLGNRLALFLLVFLGLSVNHTVSHPWRAFPHNLLLDGWFRWDSGWYLRIVQTGYNFTPGEVQLPVNVFPLYPLLIRALSVITGNPFIAGFLISNVALLFACVMLYRLVRRKYGETVAVDTLGLLLCYPFSFFMSAMYTEALFLMEAVGVFYFAYRRRWLLASVCAAAASATKVVGCISAMPLFFIYLQQANWRLANIRRNVLWLLLAPLGLVSYMVFLYRRFGDPLAFYRAQWVPGWGASFTYKGLRDIVVHTLNWKHLYEGDFDVIVMTNVTFGALALLVCLLGYRRLGWIMSLWAILTMIVSLRIWGCAGRYSSVIWPLFLGLALAIGKRRILFTSVITGFCLIQALLVLMFSHGQNVY